MFGFLSVLLRGATLTFQTLTVGGILFLVLVLRSAASEAGDTKISCLRWTRRFALALVVAQSFYLLATALILMQSAEIGLADVIGANFVFAGALGIAGSLTIGILSGFGQNGSERALLLPAAAIIASSVLTSHAMARLEYRFPLALVTALHQLATAAWLTSLPPAVDLVQDRVSAPEIYARMTPRSPRLSSPAMKDLPEDVYAAQRKAFEMGSLSSESYVPGQSGTRPNTPAEKAWSECNHHWAGIIVLSVGLLALLAQAGKISWARNWPLLFLGLSVFLFLRSDPEVWPLGPNGFWVYFADTEVWLYCIFVELVISVVSLDL